MPFGLPTPRRRTWTSLSASIRGLPDTQPHHMRPISTRKDTSQGFLFNEKTMMPNLDSPGFLEAVRIMKSIWKAIGMSLSERKKVEWLLAVR